MEERADDTFPLPAETKPRTQSQAEIWVRKYVIPFSGERGITPFLPHFASNLI